MSFDSKIEFFHSLCMYCIKSPANFEEIIKKSRFIGVIVPCSTENAALQHLKQLYSTHSNANHIAFAYRIKTPEGLVCRFHDAGEPTGTAGKPIYQHLEGKHQPFQGDFSAIIYAF